MKIWVVTETQVIPNYEEGPDFETTNVLTAFSNEAAATRFVKEKDGANPSCYLYHTVVEIEVEK